MNDDIPFSRFVCTNPWFSSLELLSSIKCIQYMMLSLQEGIDGGQCEKQTAECRLQTRGKMQTEGKMQTADVLTELSYHFHYREPTVNRPTGVLLRLTGALFRLTGAQTFTPISLNNAEVSLFTVST